MSHKPFRSSNAFALDGVGPNAFVLEVLDDEYGDATAHLPVVFASRFLSGILGVEKPVFREKHVVHSNPGNVVLADDLTVVSIAATA